MSRSRSFNYTINSDKRFLLLQLHEHFERLFESITEQNLEIKSASILLRTKTFQTLIFENKLQEHTNNRNLILSVLLNLFEKNYTKDLLYRSV
jgi:hypothetical protein